MFSNFFKSGGQGVSGNRHNLQHASYITLILVPTSLLRRPPRQSRFEDSEATILVTENDVPGL